MIARLMTVAKSPNLAILCMFWTAAVFAQQRRGGPAEDRERPAAEKNEKKAEVTDRLVTSQHTATIQGKELKYTAVAGTLVLRDDAGDPKANFFSIAYTLDGVEDRARRPITFAFNGGPGSSSVWLHLGMLGPRRVKVPDDTSVAAPPYGLKNNPHSILDLTDLVMIDPVSTGFSRPAEGEDKSQFHGYEEDIQSVGQFIHDYVTKNDRWLSPKFVIGESYGGIRSAGLSGHLLSRYRMPLCGIVMVSPAINFYTLGFNAGNDLPYILFMPTYATTAWYHKALADDLQRLSVDEIHKQALEFATTEYVLALVKGHKLSDGERRAVAEKLARFTGLSREFVEDANLRISMQRFAKELLRSRGLTVGRYDGRFTGVDADRAGEAPEYDPSGSKVFGAFTAAINDYLRNELKFEDDKVYEILGGNVQPWNYGRGNRTLDTSDTLRSTMAQNPLMKVFLAAGYYDMACPPATAIYSLEHMALPAELQENLTYGFYEAGHMMYIYEPAMEKLRKDVEQFYKEACPPTE
jgi:carboxypeptidase C (cathepsin A)